MQNRYFADIDSFGKYGIIRILIRFGFKPGVNWYLVPDDNHSDERKYTAYLNRDIHKTGLCDTELYNFLKMCMSELSEGEKGTGIIEKSGLFGNASFYNEKLLFPSDPDWKVRRKYRKKWFSDAMKSLAGSDVVFCDPDNGFEIPSVGKTSEKAGKYIFFEEAREMFSRGKSLVICHRGPKRFGMGELELEPYIDDIRCRLSEKIGNKTYIECMRWETTAKCFYFWIMQPEHRAEMIKCIRKLADKPWGKHFRLIN